mgnify:CR=1 FL=1
MKIFAVRDEDNTTNKAVAYLFYYEKEKRFYIELPEEADPWETPLIQFARASFWRLKIREALFTLTATSANSP